MTPRLVRSGGLRYNASCAGAPATTVLICSQEG
jgi:hypothetical protein